MSKPILVIVESPGKIKKINSILGNNYIVKASVGHVRDLDFNKAFPAGWLGKRVDVRGKLTSGEGSLKWNNNMFGGMIMI